MKSIYTERIKFSDAEIACEVMDYLNEHGIKHDITLEGRQYAFEIVLSRLQYGDVAMFIEEVAR